MDHRRQLQDDFLMRLPGMQERSAIAQFDLDAGQLITNFRRDENRVAHQATYSGS
jgi:hypothetical protein